MSEFLDDLVEIKGGWFLPAIGHFTQHFHLIDSRGEAAGMDTKEKSPFRFFYTSERVFVYATSAYSHRSLEKCVAKMKLFYHECNIDLIPFRPNWSTAELTQYVRTTTERT